MRTKVSSAVLACAALLLPLVSAGAAPPEGGEKMWVLNLGNRPAAASLDVRSGRAAVSEVISLEAGAAVEMPATQPGDVRELLPRDGAALFVLKVPESFDLGAVEIEGAPTVRFDHVRRQPRVIRPDWVEALMVGGGVLTAGQKGRVFVESQEHGARIEVALAFRQADSAARLRLVGPDGRELNRLTASSAQPVRWRAALGGMPAEGFARVEIEVLRGSVHATAVARAKGGKPVRPMVLAAISGSAYFTPTVNWYGDMKYYVTNGPAHTCGDLWTRRNGNAWTMEAAGWLCTNGSGYAEKGPWSAANQPGDETALVYIKWPNGDTTNTSTHIWDRTDPTATITASSAVPRTSFSGTASDGVWGNGFKSGSAICEVEFWGPDGTGWMGGSSYSYYTQYYRPCTFSGMPSSSVTWSATVPPASAHQSGKCYTWRIWVYDGGRWGLNATTFCMP